MRKNLMLLTGLLLSLNVMADNKQTLTIDGAAVDKVVTQITFDGDNAVLTYSDASTQTADMSLVSLSFEYDATGIATVETAEKTVAGKVYNLNGQLVGTSTSGLSKGVYIVNGKKMIIK